MYFDISGSMSRISGMDWEYAAGVGGIERHRVNASAMDVTLFIAANLPE